MHFDFENGVDSHTIESEFRASASRIKAGYETGNFREIITLTEGTKITLLYDEASAGGLMGLDSITLVDRESIRGEDLPNMLGVWCDGFISGVCGE
jgi:hypothetical protein